MQQAQVVEHSELTCRPNPVTDIATLSFWLEKQEPVTLSLYDVQGRLVRTVINNQQLLKGEQTVQMNTDGLINGLYFCRLTTPTKQLSQKVLIAR